jgi:ferric enterobactin receptor
MLYGLELGISLKSYKWLSFYLGANVYNYKIDGDLDALGSTSTVNNSNWVYVINSNSTINFDKTWSITTNANYTSAKLTTQGADSRF